jgi:Ca2+-transporting ATPase
MIYVPALQWIFKTEPLTVEEWVRVFLFSGTVVFAVEIDKWLCGRRGHA